MLAVAVKMLRRVAWIVDPGAPDPAVVAAVLCRPSVRRAIHNADVIDLQWAEYARLAPLIRAMNPRARIVLTFHDVLSQRFRRRAQSERGWRAMRWRWAAWLSDRADGYSTNAADVSIVFSEKDRELLPRRHRAVVVSPPLGTGETRAIRGRPGSRRIVFVGAMSRVENEEAMLWFLQEIWPGIVERSSDIELVIAGANPSDMLSTAAEAAPGDVHVTGFVDDLDVVYRDAGVIVVPLLRGAGLKFKSVEAMLSGTPTVLTSVGAEGIPESDLFWKVTDEARAFGNAVWLALDDPSASFRHAAAAARASGERYSRSRFERVVKGVYLPTASDHRGGQFRG